MLTQTDCRFMKKLYAIFLLILMSLTAQAHQPDLSMLMIYQNAEGKYFLQLSCSLLAFESMVDYEYGKNSYKTPEEFKRLFIKLFQECYSMESNNQNEMSFGNTKVMLGHETKLIAEVLNMPKDSYSFQIRNNVFKEMPQNQCILIFTGENLPKQQFILSKENNNEIKLRLENGKWSLENYEKINRVNFKIILSIVFALVLLIGTIIFLKIPKQKLLILTINKIKV